MFVDVQHLSDSIVQLLLHTVQQNRTQSLLQELAVTGRMQNLIWLELGQCLIQFKV